MMNPIGVSFLPSDENAAQGLQRGKVEGDLGQAFKILSLRLPRVQGAPGITPQSNLQAPGSAGMGGFNPQAAIFDAMIRAMSGGGAPMPGAMSGPVGPPRVIPGSSPIGAQFTGQPQPTAPAMPFRRGGPLTRDGSY